MARVDFQYLTQEFDSNILDLVNQKGFYPYEYMSDFEKFKKIDWHTITGLTVHWQV